MAEAFWANFSETGTVWDMLYDQRCSREEDYDSVVLRDRAAHLSKEVCSKYRRSVCRHKFEVQHAALQHRLLKKVISVKM